MVLACQPFFSCPQFCHFSLIETAKLNNLEPYAYLRYLFEQLPLAQSDEDLKRLMPQHIDPVLLPSPSVR
jgi:transposase